MRLRWRQRLRPILALQYWSCSGGLQQSTHLFAESCSKSHAAVTAAGPGDHGSSGLAHVATGVSFTLKHGRLALGLAGLHMSSHDHMNRHDKKLRTGGADVPIERAPAAAFPAQETRCGPFDTSN